MNIAFLQPDAHALPNSRTVSLKVVVRNGSGEAWRAADGFAIAYQVFDAGTAALIEDGSRAHPAREVAPGETMPVSFGIALPEDDGSYQIFVSAMREGAYWHYDRGWPFLLLQAVVRNRQVEVKGTRVVTKSQLRLRRLVSSIPRALWLPVTTIWRNRSVIGAMVRRDIQARYRGSVGGAVWTLLQPLLLILVYFFVFGLVLQARFEGSPGRSGFALYFVAGVLPWLAFSEAVGRAPSVIAEHRNFVKKLVFAVETLPVNLVISGLIGEVFALIVLCACLLGIRGAIPASALWLPALIVPQLLLTAGMCWLLAALGVFARDLGQVTALLLTVWFFVTPICYPETLLGKLPHSATLLLSKNPIYVLVRGYRAVLLEGQAPAFGPLWKLWAASAVVFVLGHACFHKLRKSFADVI